MITEVEHYGLYKKLDVPSVEDIYRVPNTWEEAIECMKSKLWRLNNLYTITNKDGELVRFVMNWAQHAVYAESLRHPRIIVLKSRQQGISTLWLVSFFDDAIFEDNFELGLMTQGMKESKTLFRRVKRLWDELPADIKDFLKLKLVTDTKEEIGLSNGSTMYIQTSFRSGTLQRLHISEFGKIAYKYPEKALETKTGTLQTIRVGNTVVIESTAESGDNMFKHMWDTATSLTGELSGKDFVPVFLSWVNDPDCVIPIEQTIDKDAAKYFEELEDKLSVKLTNEQKWWWVAQKRELGDDMGREYPGTPEEAFEVARDGSYYGSQWKTLRKNGHYIPRLYDKGYDVDVAMDLGMNDTFSIGFFQTIGEKVYIIDEYHNSGEGLAHYVDVMFKKPYKIRTVYVPHDAQQRELNTGMTRIARLRELGVRNIRLLPRASVHIGIERVRKMLDKCYIDSENCSYLDVTLKSYTKQWNEKLGQWSDKPLHNEWSNPADMIRYIAMSGAGTSSYSIKNKSSKKSKGTNVIDGLAI